MDNSIIQFKQDAISIHEQYPELNYSESEAGFPIITGELILRDTAAIFVDSYSIRIQPTPTYPFVFETGERIPVNLDWHVFQDGHCCIKSVPEEALLCRKGITLLWFIEQQLKPYFFGQKFREIHGYFLHERSHDLSGTIEFFEDVFETHNLTTIAEGLHFIKKRQEPGRVSDCFCGSGRKYRKCHRTAYRTLSIFTDVELEMYANWVLVQRGVRM
jgi:hypothetical protein